MSRKLEVKGMKFGKLTCVYTEDTTVNRRRYGLFLCECGLEKRIMVGNVVRGNTTSCGCFSLTELRKRLTKHGDSTKLNRTRIYNIWVKMKQRCLNKNCKSYGNYGGCGIDVCKEWKDSFISFKEWSLKNGYTEKLSIDRIDNNSGYRPNNCRWATQKEQSRNQRVNLKYKGECAIDASRRLGGNKMLVVIRVRRGWSLKKAFTTPVMNKV